ncbi:MULTISPECIES: hypothetical protein [Micromonospora]|nr:hypothetical protein [Micromonospora sp. NBRC 107095]
MVDLIERFAIIDLGKGHLTTLDISTNLSRLLVADGIWPRPTQ